MRGKTTAHPWVLSKNQARARQQQWDLSREEYDDLWQGKEDKRGRSSDSLSLCRVDLNKPWSKENCVLMTRTQYREKMKERNRKSKQQEEK